MEKGAWGWFKAEATFINNKRGAKFGGEITFLDPRERGSRAAKTLS